MFYKFALYKDISLILRDSFLSKRRHKYTSDLKKTCLSTFFSV